MVALLWARKTCHTSDPAYSDVNNSGAPLIRVAAYGKADQPPPTDDTTPDALTIASKSPHISSGSSTEVDGTRATSHPILRSALVIFSRVAGVSEMTTHCLKSRARMPIKSWVTISGPCPLSVPLTCKVRNGVRPAKYADRFGRTSPLAMDRYRE